MLTEIAPRVLLTRSAWFSTNSVVVAADDGAALLVDPGVSEGELAAMAGDIARRGLRVVAAFSTHPHWDHLLWHPTLGRAARWATPDGAAEAVRSREILLAEAGRSVGPLSPALRDAFGAVSGLPADDDGGWSPVVAVVLEHRGHARGHAALLLPEHRVLVAGDMLSDVEVPLLDLEAADPLGDYRAGLDLLAATLLDGRADAVVPGHGTVATAKEALLRVAADRAYLDDLAASRPAADQRLRNAPGWLRAEHSRQARAIRSG